MNTNCMNQTVEVKLSLGTKGPRLNLMSQFCTVLHFFIKRICIYPYNAQKDICLRDRAAQYNFILKKKALPIIDSTCVCKWSSSHNPLFVKGLGFFFYFPYVFPFSILLMHFLIMNHCCSFFKKYLFQSCQKNMDWTESMNCQDQNVARRKM